MKKNFIATCLFVVTLSGLACKKANEVPERREGYLREYAAPIPDILTQQERQEVEAKRNEYANFLNTANN